MILQALNDYYQRLSEDPEVKIAEFGYAEQSISFALVLSPSGELVTVQDLRKASEKKAVPQPMLLPILNRTSGILPGFLWDKTAYVLGRDDESKLNDDEREKKRQRNKDTFQSFCEFHQEVLTGVEDEGASALIHFLEQWQPEKAVELDDWEEMAGKNLVFRLDGERRYLHQRPAIREAWERRLAERTEEAKSDNKTERGMCLISGRADAPIPPTHPSIKGVWGAQSTGAALVSFNNDAFTSYGKKQNHNAPVGEEAAFAYTTALNHLLRRDSRNRVQIGDASTMFWAGSTSGAEEFITFLFEGNLPVPPEAAEEDRAQVQKVHSVLEAIREGKHPPELGDSEVPFYILGLGPNAARLAVRFWHVDTVGGLAANLGQHFQDLALERRSSNDPEFPTVWRLLMQLTPQREGQKSKAKDIPAPLAAGFMRAVLTGGDYPAGLYSALLGRFRADHHISYLRVSLLKACLKRRARKTPTPHSEEGLTMSLNAECNEPGYLLGRMFAVMEKTQRDALGDINATIKDRFYGAASATPGVVFPHLLAKTQHHISKAEYGGINDRKLQEICDLIKVGTGRPGFPAHLNSEQQGFFALGYYHQRNDLWRKKDKTASQKPAEQEHQADEQ